MLCDAESLSRKSCLLYKDQFKQHRFYMVKVSCPLFCCHSHHTDATSVNWLCLPNLFLNLDEHIRYVFVLVSCVCMHTHTNAYIYVISTALQKAFPIIHIPCHDNIYQNMDFCTHCSHRSLPALLLWTLCCYTAATTLSFQSCCGINTSFVSVF